MTALTMAGALACGAAAAQSAESSAPDETFAPGRILVMPRPGLSVAALDKILVEQGGGRSRRVGSSELRVVDLAVGSERAVVARLARHPHMKFAELDRYVPAALVANDPYLGSAWHIAKINAPTAWDRSQGLGITIAILDTGVYGVHPDLAARMVPGWNIFKNTADTSDFMGHGTPVAGAAAATTNNGIGVVGVAGQAKIMPLVVTDSTGGSFYSVLAQAITYAADHGARVASISFSGLTYSAAVQSAAQYMKNKGGLVVVAAGNTGATSTAPSTSTMIAVSATESNDSYAAFSTYGAFVAMSAPGNGIYSTARGGGYGTYWGTSFSTPIVAGTVALMMAANPRLSSTEIEALLYKTATDLGVAGRDPHFGYGRVNASAAVSAAATAVAVVADTTRPLASITAPLGSSTVSGLVPVNVSATDNVAIVKVELRAKGILVATDTTAPFGFSWDSTRVANGSTALVATAYDAAGNAGASATVTVNVANVAATLPATASADLTAPSITVLSPTSNALQGGTVTVSDSATDNLGATGITQWLYINNSLVFTATGGSLSYAWNTRGLKAGAYTLKFVARDAAGNTSTVSRQVIK